MLRLFLDSHLYWAALELQKFCLRSLVTAKWFSGINLFFWLNVEGFTFLCSMYHLSLFLKAALNKFSHIYHSFSYFFHIKFYLIKYLTVQLPDLDHDQVSTVLVRLTNKPKPDKIMPKLGINHVYSKKRVFSIIGFRSVCEVAAWILLFADSALRGERSVALKKPSTDDSFQNVYDGWLL